MNASTMLEEARQARRDGDLNLCIERASAAVSLAEQEKKPEVAYHANACVGRLYLSRGEAKDSLAWFRWALDAAMQGGLVVWLPAAYHDVYLAARDAGCDTPRQRWGAPAFALYRDMNPKHPGITGLLADFASELLHERPDERDGAAHAVQAWRAVPVSMPQPRFHLNASANVMHASALLGIRCRYQSASEALEMRFATLPHMEHAARTLADAGRSATIAHDFPRAAALAERSRLIAESRGESLVHEWADEVLRCAVAERVAAL